MRIESARYEDGELRLKCSPPDGLKVVYSFKAGDYELLPEKKKKKRRSLDANAYAWVLIDKLAEKLNLSPMEIYRNAVRDTGGVSETPELVELSKLESTIIEWVDGHLGRQVKIFPGYEMSHVNVIRVHGSSDYDTGQMARFIDGLVQDAEALGIETKDPKEIESLLNSWEARH